MNKTILVGIGIAAIAIAVFALALSNPNLRENKETYFGFVDVTSEPEIPVQKESSNISSSECLGTAGCITGTVTSVIDGDALEVDGQVVRFALVDTPKMKYDGGQALSFLEQICPVGSPVLIDQDDEY